MIAASDSFSYIRTDSKGKPYTIKVTFIVKPQSYEISTDEPMDVIAVTVQEIDEESGFQEIYNYYITEANGEFSIGRVKNHRFDIIKSELLEDLKRQVLDRYTANF